MTAISDANRLAAAQAELVRRARAELDTVWRLIDVTGDYHQIEAALAQAVQAIVDRYGSIGATVAAEWYDDLRAQAGAPGQFSALAAQTPPPEQIDAITHYATNQGLWNGDAGATLRILGEAIDRLVKKPTRDTVTGSARRDPARPRYARVPTGKSPCAFCRMLASRGYVYATAKTAQTTTSGDMYHNDCYCLPIPEWGPGGIAGYDYTPYVRDYEDGVRAAGSMDPKEILKEMRDGTAENGHRNNVIGDRGRRAEAPSGYRGAQHTALSDWDGISYAPRSDDRNELGGVITRQGWDGPMTELSDAQFDQFASQSPEPTVYRGVQDGSKTAAEFQSIFIEHDSPWIGQGIFGDGWYASTSVETANTYAMSNATGRELVGTSVIEMAFRPEAKIIALQDIPDDGIMSERARGIVAAKLGYDAILVDGAKFLGTKTEDYYVILNRTSVVVRERTP